ncbi:MAG TPA: PAS domain S-box protein, partial [Pelobium sp.]|nr:PAS domain S-box protein [Pelobium sp.]
ANQSIKHVKELGERVFNEETNSYWLWVTIRDNTNAILDTESLKKSEEKYKFLFDNNPACMMIFDWETLEIIDCNEEALLLYGYSREEILKLTIRDIRLPEDVELINNATKDEETYHNLQKRVWRHQKKNGEIFHVNINRHMIEYEGRKSSLVQITDITEQLKSQEELKRSEEQHKILYQQSPLPKIIYDIHTFTVLDINEMAIKLYGYSREEFIGKTLYDLRIPEEHHSIKNLLKRLKTLQGSENFGIFKHRRKNGTVLDIEFFGHKFNYNDKEALVAVYTDVTEKQQALKQLQDREEKLLLAQSLAKIGSWDYDLRSKRFSWSAEMYKIFDINEETLQHYNANSLIHLLDPEDQAKTYEVRKKVLATGESFKLEYRITTKNGVRKVIEEVGYGERDNKNELIRFFGTSQDITERKQAEIQVKESELKYRSFFENRMDGILLTVTDGDILAANPAACEIFRMTEEEIKQSGRMGLVDHADPRLHELLKTRQTKGKARGELTLQRKGGSKFIGELASVMFVDSQGRERTSMIIRDITKQKENEAALLESNKRFEYVTMATSDAVWDWDLKTDHINWGKGLQQIFGYSNDATVANFWSNNIHPADRKAVLDSIHQIIEGSDQKWYAEYRFKKADGNYAYVIDHGFVIRDDQQKAVRMVGAMNDITQKKQEEERLKLLESVVTNTNDAVVITEAEPFDEPGPKIIYVNEDFTRMTGYTADEVIGKKPRFLQVQ